MGRVLGRVVGCGKGPGSCVGWWEGSQVLERCDVQFCTDFNHILIAVVVRCNRKCSTDRKQSSDGSPEP